MTDFFASKSTMNFFGIPTMSLGQAEPQDETELVETQEGKDGYKKIIHRTGGYWELSSREIYPTAEYSSSS